MTLDDIDVSVDNGALTIKGEKKLARELRQDQFHRIERRYGTFSGSFSLPQTVDPHKVAAEYRQGVLTVRLPLREEAKPPMPYPNYRRASWPLSLPADLPGASLHQVMADVERLAAAAQYGWGHTIDFGPFCKEGLLGRDYLDIAGAIDDWGWWPANFEGMRVADVGCFTGGLSLLMAHRGAATVYAVDEIPQHLAQCAFLAETFGTNAVRPVLQSVYRLHDDIPAGSLDLILLAGVLYHLSDMLVGLYALRELLKPGGVLLVQSNAVEDFSHSYANFGRFFAGMWWQPTGLCVQDMCSHMGYASCDVRFYARNLCIARALRAETDIPFRRGLNWAFDEIRDRKPRSLDWHIMAPAPQDPPQ